MMEEKKEEDEEEETWLQLRPTEPLPAQCCGGGCKPCIFNIYYQELSWWEKARAKKDKSLLWTKMEEHRLSELSLETFRAFSISALEPLTDDTCQVRFALPGNEQLGLRPSQHLILRGTVDGLEIQRAYTPISHGSMEGYFEVLIKYGELLMLAAGTGLAPMLPILKEITDNEEDETFITLVGCFKTFESIYLKPFLQDQARYWNVRTFFVLSQEASLNQLPWSYQEKTHLGRLSQSLVRELVSSCRRKPFALVCGPSEFVGDMALYLQGAGLSKESYFLF
ncbi:NADH-cytochrome b5 reductase-like isoform X2 [Notamacropus eugenii]|uniref:NADH-cytochrome b5 reductase-like isoform X2 n=1 Tax=Notamacropus eugenii TaxID=9315 RepID=UPI003B6821C7